jgi:hypothetical protein
MLTRCALVALSILPQQGSQVECNNQARHKSTCAGNTSTGTANCASFSFTISIAGQSFTFSSPSACDTGRREQDKDCYECGPPSDGNHCKARGFLANVKIYSIGGGNPCPTFPDPLPTTLEAAGAAVQCMPLPLISDEDNWCATVRTCVCIDPPRIVADEGTLVLGKGRGARDYWRGTAFDLDWEGPPARTELEERLLALPRTPIEDLPGELQGALIEAAPLEGAEVSGTLDLVYFRNGEPWINNRFEFSAFICGNGIHVREREFVPDEDGVFRPRVESVLHDGRTLLVDSADSPGHAYLPGYYDLPGVLRARLAPYGCLRNWFLDPFGVQRLPGTTYESVGGPSGESSVVEQYPGIQGPGADGSTVYELGGRRTFPRFKICERRNASGATTLRRTFADYSEVMDGLVRPRRMTETIYDSEGKIELSRTLTLRHAGALSVSRARQRGWLTPQAADWYVYQ